ncbi:MAG: DUF3450 domain-containing protein [Methylococcales bacterium]|nr:DUF3450 domain-containing protein [Methylococcales bacterium]
MTLLPDHRLLAVLFVAGGLFTAQALATDLRRIEKAQNLQHQQAKASQKSVENLDDQAQDLFQQYRAALTELESLKSYHDQLAKVVASQEQEKQTLAEEMQQVEITQRKITPLMVRMIDVLEDFIALDMPFLPEERQLRLLQLRELMDRADNGLGEKYRRLLHAYMVETEYGRTLEAYSGEINLDDGAQTVDFFRLGRLGFYYLTLDRNRAGIWNNQTRQWQTLDDNYIPALEKGLAMAKKQAPPELLMVPLPTAQAEGRP